MLQDLRCCKGAQVKYYVDKEEDKDKVFRVAVNVIFNPLK